MEKLIDPVSTYIRLEREQKFRVKSHAQKERRKDTEMIRILLDEALDLREKQGGKKVSNVS